MHLNAVEKVLLFSGKRKSGKDFITEKLLKEKLGLEKAQIIRISEPIKSTWAVEKKLDLAELLSDGAYKEQYRREMIVWSEEMRKKDFGIFCKAAAATIDKSIVIVSDIRRQTDIKWFRENFGEKVRLIRIKCDDKIRSERGWIFQEGVDDKESECDLDEWTEWDLTVENEGENNTEDIMSRILSLV